MGFRVLLFVEKVFNKFPQVMLSTEPILGATIQIVLNMSFINVHKYTKAVTRYLS